MKTLQEKLKAALLAAREICDLAEVEKRDFSAEEQQKIKGYIDEAGTVKAQIKTAEGDEALRKSLTDLGVGMALNEEQRRGQQAAGAPGKGTWGQRFVEAPEIKTWLARFPEGRVPESMKGVMSPPVMFGAMFERKAAELITGEDDTSAGAFVSTDVTGIYEPLGRMPLTIRDLINKRTTGGDLVEFVRQTAQVAAAATVAEANAEPYSGASGQVQGVKPQGGMNWEKVTAAVKTIAVWVAATKRALADVGQLRGIIDQELRDDIDEELEDQILNGDGVGENFEGLANTAGTLTQAFNTDILTSTRQAVTTLQVTGRSQPTAWVFNPIDWETIDLMQDLQGHYYWGGPLSQGTPRLWGYPVVQCQGWAAGTAWLGDWRKAVLWDRLRTTLTVSDSHEDFFIRNLIAILAEMRAAFGLIRPSAFIEVNLA